MSDEDQTPNPNAETVSEAPELKPDSALSQSTANWIVDSTATALKQIIHHADCVGLPNTDEFTFRSMFMSATYKILTKPSFQTEWKKFDLLVQAANSPTLIEFKYYLLRRTFDLDGSPQPYKSYASLHNESNFGLCIQKLHKTEPICISDRFLVLVYQREYERKSHYSYHRSFGSISITPPVTAVWPLSYGPLEARIIKVRVR